MEMAPKRFFPMSKSTYVLHVTGYKDKCLSGILTVPLLGKSYSIANMVQLLRTMDTLMNEANFPQHCVEPRAFQSEAEAYLPPETDGKSEESIAVFDVNVMFRQNASWQGSVLWREKNLESRFRSVLELIGLVDDALSAE